MYSLLSDLPPRDSILVVATCALATHLVFNRFEPTDLPIVAAALLAPPTALSPLLAHNYGILGGIALSFAIFYATLVSSVFLYRVTPFHPLARYPGPFLAKITRWYWTLIAVKGYQHIELKRLHEIHGDIVRIGPNELSFRDVSMVQHIMGAHGMPKGPMWDGRAFKPPVLPLVGLREVAEHSRRRRPWNRAFSTAALKEYEPVIAKRGAQLVEILAERKEADFARWVHFLTFDIMSDALFGGNLGAEMMATEDKDGIMRSMKVGWEAGQVFEHVPWFGYWVRYFPKLGAPTQKFRAMCIEQGKRRYQDGSKQKDLFYYLSNEDGSEKQTPDITTVLSDSVLAIVAGSDTTATVFINLLYCLLRNPEAYKRLQAEVDQFYPPEENSLDPKHHLKMPYLEAVINETLRLFPVVPSGSPRAPERGSGGAVVGPYFIPENTCARVHFWSVHHDARNFSLPETFLPERWLVAEGVEDARAAALGLRPGSLTHNMNAFVPFSFGPWNCVGKNLALLELQCVTTHMMQRLNFRFQKGWDPSMWEPTVQDKFVVKTGRLPIIVERRF
ncbi:uncharacterized protein PHACADRAFT_211341 [Phanerochaete carnosa HHB-10118-sp]|uniref:Cytochrome P450 n=1 Tax=Phanerochaete carnosa (strain HHB-10118-sp) TaxID=650164 RepID=K5W3F7_PHACS|nr:uncharacterized protein PHACADRAFT_211341 [Phanerochaete carnosa HHB-10118-sp]EKM53670.1 hypothetical protein PHACADRAFT_211341 [Phanerochaete carnosa HHB-10118-sp]